MGEFLRDQPGGAEASPDKFELTGVTRRWLVKPPREGKAPRGSYARSTHRIGRFAGEAANSRTHPAIGKADRK
ncbi:hypothetical protein MOX02_34440 [Methylobacterium oxalidis]|uniref:Uncharacterized protein n=1 Tax=Methylobacterium oxalidis TaxID=944322 RepID=A0A512J608_9HYPH|nr:hypothetical protein MOX02_34440 [Methylobacterium oxalidis]GLS66296.1 hypothetical protein GCM10007888_46780 [Methylobacterium oxalidis]